jgi:P27 family predicted phage terminase small subunit
MPAGRRPTPTKLKVLHGNPGRRPLNESEPQPEGGLPTCPAELNDAARLEWRRVGRELERLGLVSRLDRAALAAYCEAWAQWLEAIAAVQKTGAVVKAPSGYPILNPHLAVANQAYARMKAMLVEFGMTPSSRTRLVGAPGESEDDPAAEFFADDPLPRRRPPRW